MHILVSGANGFVGGFLCDALSRRDHNVYRLSRTPGKCEKENTGLILNMPDFIGIDQSLARSAVADTGLDAVIHLAARVHVTRDDHADAYRATNVEASLRLAQAAQRAGARRFVLVSSSRALGDRDDGVPLNELDIPKPADPYGISKLEAECELTQYCHENGMEYVCIRPPLVYGPGVRANFLHLMKAVERGIPLPLGRASAVRSMIYVENLVDALVQCTELPRAAGLTLHVSDLDDVAVNTLIRDLARLMDRPARLLPVPVQLLRCGGAMLGKSAEIARLVTDFRLDCALIQQRLGWQPPFTRMQGLTKTTQWLTIYR